MNSGKKQVVVILKHVTSILALSPCSVQMKYSIPLIVIIICTTEGAVINLPGSQIYSVSKKKNKLVKVSLANQQKNKTFEVLINRDIQL